MLPFLIESCQHTQNRVEGAGASANIDRIFGLADALLGRGFSKERVERLANLEDVFIDLTGHDLREGD